MSLKPIVAALGGDLYAGGRRANIPAPGHSPSDRSISLLCRDDRLIIHGFGATDWRAARDDLLRRGLIHPDGRLVAAASGPFPSGGGETPDLGARRRVATRLWEAGLPLAAAQASVSHLLRRGVENGLDARALRHHPAAPISVYAERSPLRPALMARVSAPDGALTAVELTYLQPGGAAAALRVPRKTVGRVAAGSAVRLAEPARRLLVAEGVVTTLSAMARFGLPGWALLSVRNLAAWSPPPQVRRVLIAGDRGAPGEAAARSLQRRLQAFGIAALIRLPPAPFGDWNEAAAGDQRREEGTGEAPERRG